jgi:hypothetical protein
MPTNYLHPLLQQFLTGMDVGQVTSHPLFSALMQSHPDTQQSQSQMITAHGGEEIIPAQGKPDPTVVGPTGGPPNSSPPGMPGFATGGVVNPQSLTTDPTSAIPSDSPEAVYGQLNGQVWYDPWNSGPQGYGTVATMPVGGWNPNVPVAPPAARGWGAAGNPGNNPTSAAGYQANPYSYSGAPTPHPATGYSPGGGTPVWQNPNAPIGQAQATQMSGVAPGPLAMNHVPYGPELTGLSGFGGLITPNGTPVPMSQWQQTNLDPTSIGRYNSYVSDVAGMNPADLKQVGTSQTATQMPSLTPPTKFTPINPIPAASGG